VTATTLTPTQAELLHLLDATPRSAQEFGFAVQRDREAVRSTLLSLAGKGLAKRDLATGKWTAA